VVAYITGAKGERDIATRTIDASGSASLSPSNARSP